MLDACAAAYKQPATSRAGAGRQVGAPRLLNLTTFCLFGLIIGIGAKGFEQLQFIPMLVITPLTFLGGRVLFDRHAAAGLADGGR